MGSSSKQKITENDKKKYISALTSELPVLRAKAGVSQDELARLIGISRQTLGAIERREREMSWNTYLSLIFYFDNNKSTRQTIRSMDAFPHSFVESISGSEAAPDKLLAALAGEYGDIFAQLDEQALHSIRTMIMIEYARCTNQSGEAVIKSFDGMNFMNEPQKTSVSSAIRSIRRNSNAE